MWLPLHVDFDRVGGRSQHRNPLSNLARHPNDRYWHEADQLDGRLSFSY
jgi:hypothetical protein